MKKLHILTALCLISALLLSCVFTASADNAAPVAENQEISTYRGVSVSGQLAAMDPEGEAVTFQITTPPIKGAILLEEDGRFTYTPADGKRGKDYFGYKAMDESGSLSHEATVIIRIEKPKSKVTYSDMAGNGAAYAAVRLAEEEIFVGECLGGKYVFSPDTEVSRGEFLAMCMKLADTELLSGVQRTGFADDRDIPQWMRPYVSTALLCGAITGESGERGATFSPARAITGAEAAAMLNNVLGLNNVSYEVPQWAAQAVMNLSASRIILSGAPVRDALTRADAAMMLLRAMEK
jgi:hypothetical protein